MTTPVQDTPVDPSSAPLEPWTDLRVSEVLEIPTAQLPDNDSSFRVTLISTAGRTGQTGLGVITVETVDAHYLDGELAYAIASGPVMDGQGTAGAQWMRGTIGNGSPGQTLAEAVIAGLPTAIAVTRDARVGATYLRFADLPVTRTERVNTSVNADYSGHTLVGIELI